MPTAEAGEVVTPRSPRRRRPVAARGAGRLRRPHRSSCGPSPSSGWPRRRSGSNPGEVRVRKPRRPASVRARRGARADDRSRPGSPGQRPAGRHAGTALARAETRHTYRARRRTALTPSRSRWRRSSAPGAGADRTRETRHARLRAHNPSVVGPDEGRRTAARLGCLEPFARVSRRAPRPAA